MIREKLAAFARHDVHPALQFIKYVMAGGLATVVDVVVFYLLAWKFFPALTVDDKLVQLLGINITVVAETVRANHYILDRCITFFFSNMSAYIANVLWVFTPGRHSRSKEIVLFYAVSGISFLVATGLSWAFIKFGGFTTSFAYLINMIVSVLINYVCRKFYVFKG